MPGTVDDFINRFGGNQTIDDQEAAQYHERFVSTHPNDSAFDNQTYHQGATEYLGKLPDDQFHQAASSALAQTPPQERQGLLSGLLGALGGGALGSGLAGGSGMGGGLGNIASLLGLGSTDPSKMSNDDATRVMNYARREQPQALQQVVQDKPWFLKAMGNPIVVGALTMAAAKLVNSQRRR